MSSRHEEADQIIGRGVQLLNSTNPMDRRKGIEMINSHEAFMGDHRMAFGVAWKLYPDEMDPEVKSGLFEIIANSNDGRDPRVMNLLIQELDSFDLRIKYIAIGGLRRFKENAAPALPKLKEIAENPATPGTVKRLIIGGLEHIGKASESVIDIVTKELGSSSWLMRRVTKKAVEKLNKKGVNVVGYLVKQLESGTPEEKVAACQGLGSLEKDAKGAVTPLANALKDPAVDVRGKAAWALWKMEKNASPAEAQLTVALQDESPVVAKYAFKALTKFKKLSKEEKEQIKEMEDQENEIKKIRKQFGYQELKEPKEDEEEKTEVPVYKNRFFMSHSTKDFPWVQKVSNVIEKWPGCKCWLCERDIFHGQDWLEAIYDGIESCNWYILFWSPNADASKWTQEEIREAKLRNVQSNDTNPKISIVNLGMPDLPRLIQRHQGSKVASDADIASFCEHLKTQVEM